MKLNDAFCVLQAIEKDPLVGFSRVFFFSIEQFF